jgi:hypothetical protein
LVFSFSLKYENLRNSVIHQFSFLIHLNIVQASTKDFLNQDSWFCDAETTPLISEKFLALHHQWYLLMGNCWQNLQKYQPARNFRKFIPFLEVMFENAFDEGKTRHALGWHTVVKSV